jgi:ankyrin repeat protein
MTPKQQASLDSRLIEAANRGDTKAVQTLLASGANVNAKDAQGYDALCLAAKGGHTETVRTLLSVGADVHATNDSALCSAANRGRTETVKVLLAAGADVHAENEYALCWAAYDGRAETVKVLLASGANVHEYDDYALRWAANNGHAETVQVLARHIFAPDSWRGKSRVEIEAAANALYDEIRVYSPSNPITPERLRTAGAILLDCALTCWEQVRPPPPRFKISPIPAQPRPV